MSGYTKEDLFGKKLKKSCVKSQNQRIPLMNPQLQLLTRGWFSSMVSWSLLSDPDSFFCSMEGDNQ